MGTSKWYSASSRLMQAENPAKDAETLADAAAGDSTEEPVSEAAEAAPPADADVAAKISALEKEVQAMKDARLRALAELENVRRIAERDVANAKTYAIQKFAKQLLDVNDNLDRAIEAVPAHKADASELTDEEAAETGRALLSGVRATGRELNKVFELNQISSFGHPGDAFDPTSMEAMFAMPITDKLPASTVGQVLAKGYKFKDRVLRPARVGATPVQ